MAEESRLNPETGNIDLIGLSPTTADLTYLRLDTTNDPLTGNLEISKVSPTLTLTESSDGSFTSFLNTGYILSMTVGDGFGTDGNFYFYNSGNFQGGNIVGGGAFTMTPTSLYWVATVSPTAGADCYVIAQDGLTSGGATNLDGGSLLLQGGDAIGNGVSDVQIWAAGGGTSGSSVRASELIATFATTQINFAQPIYCTPTGEFSLFGGTPDTGLFTGAFAVDRLICNARTATSAQIRTISAIASLGCSGTLIYNNANGINAFSAYYGTETAATGTLSASTSGNGGALKGFRAFGDWNGTAWTGATVTLTTGFTSGFRIDAASITLTDFADFHSEGLTSGALGTTITRHSSFWVRDGTISSGTYSYHCGLRIDSLTRAVTNIAIAIGGTGTGAGVHFNATTAAGSERIYSSASQTLDLDTKTTMNFLVSTAIEMTMVANSLTFNNGATDTALSWATSGVLDFTVAAAIEMSLAANSLTFNNGATDTGFAWATSGQLDLTIGGTAEVSLTASALFPTTNDGNALGVANTNMWADLFLASGAVVNFNNGNVTLTHSAGQLAMVGALDIDVDARARQFIADGDNAGVASTNSLTNGTDTAGAVPVALAQRSGSGTSVHAGYIKIYVGTTARYIPVFD